MQRPHPPRTRIESDIVEAEDAVHEFAARNPKATVTTLRFCNGLGPDVRTSHTALLSLPAVPGILGFDPRYQFIHEDDMVGALHHAVVDDVPGSTTWRRDGVLALSEIAGPAGQAVRADARRRGARAWPPHLPVGSVCAFRTRSASNCATAAVWTTAGSSSPVTGSS